MKTTKINGMEIEHFSHVHDAIISRIVDYVTQNCGVYYMEEDDEGGRWQGPRRLPEKIFNISATREFGVSFSVKNVDGSQRNCSLGTKIDRELTEQGWLV